MFLLELISDVLNSILSLSLLATQLALAQEAELYYPLAQFELLIRMTCSIANFYEILYQAISLEIYRLSIDQ